MEKCNYKPKGSENKFQYLSLKKKFIYILNRKYIRLNNPLVF